MKKGVPAEMGQFGRFTFIILHRACTPLSALIRAHCAHHAYCAHLDCLLTAADSFVSFAGRSGEPGERKRTGRTNRLRSVAICGGILQLIAAKAFWIRRTKDRTPAT
jgi:hypothetical protein